MGGLKANQAQELLDRASQTLRSAGFNVESVGCRSGATAGIIDFTEELYADLIILGSHGRTVLGLEGCGNHK
jgi:nucleotide-binding universal stress UspA family protein